MNALLIGALTPFLDVKLETWKTAIKKFVPEKLREINLSAFYSGCKLIREKGI
jgi:Pyruvate/2-oxoacid:ferredoxin oxidoreductase gamma subunit